MTSDDPNCIYRSRDGAEVITLILLLKCRACNIHDMLASPSKEVYVSPGSLLCLITFCFETSPGRQLPSLFPSN